MSSTIITTAELKTFLKISPTDVSEDAFLELIVDIITTTFQNYCHSDIFPTYHTDYFDIEGDFEDTVVLTYWPVLSVVAVTNHGNLLDSSDYNLYSNTGVIKRDYEDYFSNGRKSVEVTYRAGYTNVPKDIKLAAYLYAAYLRSRSASIGFLSETIGDYSYKVSDINVGSFPDEVKQLLSSYVCRF